MEAEESGNMEYITEAETGECPPVADTMDPRPLFQTLHALAEDNVNFFQESKSETGRRFVAAFTTIREHARCLEPVLSHFATIYHIFDLDEHTPANGYRSLAQTVRCCLAHIVHKSRYVAANRRSIFFRTSHNCAELEAYCTALTQLRALIYLAQRLLTQNRPGQLFNHEDRGLSEQFLREYITMHKGCFYGRCMGFQYAPSIRPFLQTIAISLVSFGENYKRHVSGIGVAASSLFTSGKFAIDPELRGTEFERITQNLDVHFWKAFWNLTELELLASLASMASSQVRLSRALLVPPHSFDLPLVADPQLTVTITPPVAHTGPGAVQMRLISHELREGQDSEELCSLMRPEGPLALELRWRTKPLPRSPYLVVHFHGGGFVAQTSKSHEPYLKSWAQELGAPILSIDYSLAPEAPFPRALEECFYAYCWAIKNCHLLGSTAQTVCLAGDSAGGNLCFTVSMRAAAFGIKMPDGIMAAYPATLMEVSASPSRLLTLLDPLLPLSVLCKCLSAYAGMEPEQCESPTLEKLSPVNMVRRDTTMLFRDLRLGATSLFGSLLENTGKINGADAPPGRCPFSWGLWGSCQCPLTQLLEMLSLVWLFRSQGSTLTDPDSQDDFSEEEPASAGGPDPGHDFEQEEDPTFGRTPQQSKTEPVRKSISEVGLKSKSLASSKESRKSQTYQNLSCASDASPGPSPVPDPPATSFFVSDGKHEAAPPSHDGTLTFPDGFQPLRSEQPATCMPLELSPIVKNPFMSPLLAPDAMLKGLPPVHIVACALDPMLDDSVMFARRLRALGQPVTLRVVQDLPHGFLSLSQLCRETRQASALCTELIRDILVPSDPPTQPPTAAASHRKHRKLERTSHSTGSTPSRDANPTPAQENRAAAAEQEGLNGAAVGSGATSQAQARAAQERQEGSRSAEGQQSGATDRSAPASGPGPSNGTVGRGVGA